MPHAIAILAVTALVALAVTMLGGIRHDYIYYLEQWQLVLAHRNPWATNNAYGPLHNAFALLLPIHLLAPKLVTAASLLLANSLLVRTLLRQRPASEWRLVYFATFAANGLVLVSSFWLGLNDGFVAALLIGAVLARHSDRLLLAGVLLGLATLDKYYPALLIPFFALDQRTFAPRLVLASLATIAVGILAAIALWGSDWFEAVAFGVSRDATILSVLRPISLIAHQIGLGSAADLLVRLNGPMVLAVWLAVIALAWRRRDHWLVAATYGFFAVLLTYKVGNEQFWVSWLVLTACLPLLGRPEADGLARLSLPYATFLSVFQFGYVLIQPEYYRGNLAWIRDWAGIPSFILGTALLIAFLRPSPSSLAREAGAPALGERTSATTDAARLPPSPSPAPRATTAPYSPTAARRL